MTIQELINEYKSEVDFLDLELLIAHSLEQTREFVLMHPEYSISKNQELKISGLISRRILGEPFAYILGHKEFYGLDFIVNKYTLIPRPETELMVEKVLDLLRSMLRSTAIVDIGTGSGCIITSIAKNNPNHLSSETNHYFATDISKEALKVARKNAKLNDVKIKFLHGNLFEPFIKEAKKLRAENLIITANLPYLSKEIYNSAPVDVKKYEPKSALYSAKAGLDHYERLLKQIKNSSVISPQSSVTCLFEISPEQKKPVKDLVESIFPKAEIELIKDLTGRWRLVKIDI